MRNTVLIVFPLMMIRCVWAFWTGYFNDEKPKAVSWRASSRRGSSFSGPGSVQLDQAPGRTGRRPAVSSGGGGVSCRSTPAGLSWSGRAAWTWLVPESCRRSSWCWWCWRTAPGLSWSGPRLLRRSRQRHKGSFSLQKRLRLKKREDGNCEKLNLLCNSLNPKFRDVKNVHVFHQLFNIKESKSDYYGLQSSKKMKKHISENVEIHCDFITKIIQIKPNEAWNNLLWH